jgi:hypothetical protein
LVVHIEELVADVVVNELVTDVTVDELVDVVTVELESLLHIASHWGEPWHPFTWFAQKTLVHSVHNARSMAIVSHVCGRLGKQQEQEWLFMMDTPMHENIKTIRANMFLFMIEDSISYLVVYFVWKKGDKGLETKEKKIMSLVKN